MTIVAAKRFGNRIIVLSDTMISDVGARADNIIPGRLKSIVLSKTLTVSYAGLSCQALDAIRVIYRSPPDSVRVVIEFLAAKTAEFTGELDFLVCTHTPCAELFKISNGRVYTGADFYWIGNSQAVSDLSQLEVRQQKIENRPEWLFEEEMHFSNKFMVYLRENRRHGVGGIVINCLCSDQGHCYQNYVSAFSWDEIIIDQFGCNRPQEAKETGMYHFECHVYSATKRGEAVVGLYLGQPGIGFIYDPLNHDEAKKIVNIAHSEFAALVGSRVVDKLRVK